MTETLPADKGTVQCQRTTKNLLLQPGLQFRLPLHLLFFTVMLAVAVWLLMQHGFGNVYVAILDQAGTGIHLEQALTALQAEMRSVAAWSAWFLMAYVVLLFAISIAYTHRLIGPTIGFRRHIAALKEGDYSSRLRIRRTDAFHEVAAELNELAEALEQRYGSRSKSDAT